ncbi:hypothetical protein Tco_1137802 [Tanacetum coccineum]
MDQNEENTDSYETLRRNPYDSVTPLSYPSQHYGITQTLDYAVTSFKLVRWKVRVSSLQRKPLKGTTAGVDINTLTIEQYLALSRENQAPGVVKQEIRGNVNFEIKSQFMRELREDTCSKNKNEDVHDHVDRVLNIVSFFNIFGVSQDAVLLCVFPFTLTGSAKRWVDRLTPGAVNTWDLLKKPLSKGIVYHPTPLNDFKQESD